MKEVKIKINVEKIFTACQGIEPTDDLLKYDTPKDYRDLIDRIFKDSIEIASDADDKIASSADNEIANSASNDKEKELILKILNNRVREFFTYNIFGRYDIHDLYKSLKDKKLEKVRKHSIDIINELIKPNTFIYNPQDGIHIQHSKDNIPCEYVFTGDEISALHPRTYTLKIDCTDSSTLDSILHLTTKSKDREFFCRFSYLLFSEHSKYIPRNKNKDINILKKYSPKKKKYSIYDLYNQHADDGTLLVDHGLKLIYNKYYEILELCETVEKMKVNSDSRELILGKIRDTLDEGELRIVTSIIDNIDEIKNEKNTQKGMISAIEYMADNNILLGEKDMPKVLNINSDLSNFRKEYLDDPKGLKEKVSEREDSLNKEIEAIETDQNNKEKILEQAKREGKSAGEIEGLEHSIDELSYEIYLLEDKLKKQIVQLSNVNFNMHFYDSMEPIQQKHILKKIGEVALRKKIELRVKKIFRIVITRRQLAYISIVLTVVLITLGIIFSGYILDNEIKVGRIISR